MIDLHNHILPDWDDGPSTIEKSLEMARQAVRAGTTIMVATPHRFTNGKESRANVVRERVEALTIRLYEEKIPLEILSGVEIPVDFGVSDEVWSGNLTTLGGGNYLLLEPPFPDLPHYLIPAIEDVFSNGFGVVLAHPERNSEVQKSWIHKTELDFVTKCAQLGCVIQLTSGSIVGRFGHSAQDVSRAIVRNRGWKIVISSDSHDPKERTPEHLTAARDQVAAWIDDPDAASVMVNALPAHIINR